MCLSHVLSSSKGNRFLFDHHHIISRPLGVHCPPSFLLDFSTQSFSLSHTLSLREDFPYQGTHASFWFYSLFLISSEGVSPTRYPHNLFYIPCSFFCSPQLDYKLLKDRNHVLYHACQKSSIVLSA